MMEGDARPCGGCSYCCNPVTSHRFTTFADVMYLRFGNADVAYAQEQLGVEAATAVPTGHVATAAPDYQTGIRFGMAACCSPCSSIVARYTWFGIGTNSSIQAGNGAVLASLVMPPNVQNCGTQSLSSTASYNITLNRVDLDYRHLLAGDCDWAVNWLAGVRYAGLDQDFSSKQLAGVPAGLTDVTTKIGFDGLGIGLGIDILLRRPCSGFFLFGRGDTSFLGGEFNADYRLTSQFGGGVDVTQSLVNYRMITMLDGELGVGWESPRGYLRLTAGYQVSGWYNTLMMNNYLNGVAHAQVAHLDDTVTLNGVIARVEWRL